jgi:hypothetical protein
MNTEKRVEILRKILVEFDSQRSKIESTIKKIEKLYFNGHNNKDHYPRLS